MGWLGQSRNTSGGERLKPGSQGCGGPESLECLVQGAPQSDRERVRTWLFPAPKLDDFPPSPQHAHNIRGTLVSCAPGPRTAPASPLLTSSSLHCRYSSHPTPLGLPQTSQKRPTNHTQHNQRKPCRCSSQHTQGSPQGRACADFSAYLLAFCPWAATCLPRGNPMGSCHAGTEGREGALC